MITITLTEHVVELLVRLGSVKYTGIFQYTAKSDISYYEAALSLAKQMDVYHNLVQPCESISSRLVSSGMVVTGTYYGR